MREADAAVSVVIPTYNRASSLRRTLSALEAQEPVPGGFELIVVDDGSSDDTEQVVQASALHPRYVRQENQGAAAARNTGWRMATGHIVAFTDDDAVPDPRWLAELQAAFARDPGVAGLGGRIKPLVQSAVSDFVQLEQHSSHGVDPDGRVRYLVTANCAYRRDVLVSLNGFDISFAGASGEDTDLTLRALAAGQRLEVLENAMVAHAHPTTLRAVLRAYHRHGRTRGQVVARNPDAGWGKRRRAMATPSYWTARYRYYRSDGCGPSRAVAFTLLRATGLLWYAAGVLRSRVER